MSDPTGADAVVTIDGRKYSRMMADQMARDIDMANAIRPGAWAITDNASLIIGSAVLLSFVLPLKHEYLINATAPSDEVRRLIELHGRGSRIPSLPELVGLDLPEHERGDLLRILRPAHEAAIQRSITVFNRCHRWKWHNFQVAQTLNEIIDRRLPQPSYAEELNQLRMNEPQPAEPTVLSDISDLDRGMLEQIARDIEAAHEANPNSWALAMTKTGALALTVEALTASFVARARGGLMVLGDPNDPAFAGIDREAIQADYQYFPGFWINMDSVEQFAPLIAEFAGSHRDGVVDLALRVKTRTQRANEHQPETLAELSVLVGRGLPIPGYAISRSNEEPQRSKITAIAPLDIILDQFAANGLQYTRQQVAAFYTGLQTKGFVVLSGISGTGKSKIATGFVDMLPSPAAAAAPMRDSYGLLPIVVKRYMKESRRIVIPVRYYELLTPMERGASYQLPVSINGRPGTGRLWFRIHGGHDQYLLSFHQILSAEIDAWSEGQPIYLDIVLNAEGDKVLEMRITNEQPSASGAAEPFEAPAAASNHLFLSVRPDWRDSTSLLGYYNPLTQTYEWTEFLRFILRAQASFKANDGLAWFVILDEMNLAHVEHYFADLLSVVESGRDTDGWTREPVRLSYPDTLDEEAPPQELKLPPNLYLIGTVNMDETTHAFSPKVLDRAFTIELSEVDFLAYQLTIGDTESRLSYDQQQRLLDAFTRFDPASGRRGFARIDKREIAEMLTQRPEIRIFLDALNRRLQTHRFHFGYRVFDEIAQYLANSRRNEMVDFMPAFDQAVFMKVLPKFSGSRARLRGPLLTLLAWTLDPANPEPAVKTIQQAFLALDFDDGTALARFTQEAAFGTTARRALQMLIALENDGFVSFG